MSYNNTVTTNYAKTFYIPNKDNYSTEKNNVMLVVSTLFQKAQKKDKDHQKQLSQNNTVRMKRRTPTMHTPNSHQLSKYKNDINKKSKRGTLNDWV